MPTTLSIDSVTTPDGTPGVAPHKVSRDPAHDDVTVAFTATHDGELVPSDDLIPVEGTRYPDEGLYPDDDLYPDHGATVVEGEPRDIIGWMIRMGGIGPSSGRVVAQHSNRCSPNRVCGTRDALNNACSIHGVRLPSGEQVEVTFTKDDWDDAGPDGSRDIYVYTLTESQGWS